MTLSQGADVILRRIAAVQQETESRPLLFAIDGRCAAGKTSLAALIREKTGCQIFHMDDFFLRPGQRTLSRLSRPGENVDWERFRQEVLLPLTRGGSFQYRPYDCKTGTLASPVSAGENSLHVIEGAYSCHPALWDFYHLRVFLTLDGDTQRKRLLCREEESGFVAFMERWIPLEEYYFSTLRVAERCDLILELQD